MAPAGCTVYVETRHCCESVEDLSCRTGPVLAVLLYWSGRQKLSRVRVRFRAKVRVRCSRCGWDGWLRWNFLQDRITRFPTAYSISKIFRFLARDVIYTSRAYATMLVSVCLSVRLSVMEVYWVAVHAGKRGGVISTTSRAMLATARPSCAVYGTVR